MSAPKMCPRCELRPANEAHDEQFCGTCAERAEMRDQGERFASARAVGYAVKLARPMLTADEVRSVVEDVLAGVDPDEADDAWRFNEGERWGMPTAAVADYRRELGATA